MSFISYTKIQSPRLYNLALTAVSCVFIIFSFFLRFEDISNLYREHVVAVETKMYSVDSLCVAFP